MTERRTVLFQVVDRNRNGISGAKAVMFLNDKKFVTITTGKRAGKQEVDADARVRISATYGGFGPYEGMPDANGMCQIKFPEVDMTPTPVPPPDNRIVFYVMTVVVGIFGCAAVWGGFEFIIHGAAGGQTEISIFVATVKTAHAGVASIALGALVLLFTLRRILKTIETVR